MHAREVPGVTETQAPDDEQSCRDRRPNIIRSACSGCACLRRLVPAMLPPPQMLLLYRNGSIRVSTLAEREEPRFAFCG